MKTKVKILDSIAGLADPKPVELLDAKYQALRDGLRARKPKPVPEHKIEETIAQTKLADRYSEPILGFARDWSFRPGEEVLIDATLAEKWATAEICDLIAQSA
jgi:hypothetical protein